MHGHVVAVTGLGLALAGTGLLASEAPALLLSSDVSAVRLAQGTGLPAGEPVALP